MKKILTLFIVLYFASLSFLQAQTLYGWGNNELGQVGDGILLKFEPYQSGEETNWASVASGDDHGIAIKTDGTLWAWGSNTFGGLGDGTNINKSVPVQVGTATDWVSVAAGSKFSIAIKADGTLWAWGANHFGQLGDGTTAHRNVPVQVGSASDWAFVDGGTSHTVALKEDGSLWAWGYNDRGYLGDGTTVDKHAPVQIGTATDWSSLIVGGYHTLAIKTDGSLWAWGSNYKGQLGDGTDNDQSVPFRIGAATDWSSVTAGFQHSIAIKDDGTLWAWGRNEKGQLGDGTHNDQHQPIQISSATNWASVSAGNLHSLAIKSDGSLWAWGNNYKGQLGDGTITWKNIPIQIGTATDWAFISSGYDHTITLKTDGTMWAWGQNAVGQLGDSQPLHHEPYPIEAAAEWKSVIAGYDHTLAIKTDGTLWAWGINSNGQLGDGTHADKTIPVQIGTANDWASASAGRHQSLAIKTDGTLWAWGYNYYGQLGDGTNITRTAPVQIGTATAWASVTTGDGHSLAMKTDGTLWAWGANDHGQLGNGTNTAENVPVQVGSETNWAKIDAGIVHNLAMKTDGTLWAWGNNSAGTLGDGTTTNRNAPVQIGATADWASFSTGANHNLALKTDGSLWAWGSNAFGGLGDETTTAKNIPTRIGSATNWASVEAGAGHSLAIKSNGTLWAWGSNNRGQVGVGMNFDVHSPLQVGTANEWTAISAGGLHSMAILGYRITEAPTLTKPLQGSHSNQHIAVDFTLPQAAKAGSVQLTFTQSGGEEDPNAPHILTFTAAFEEKGQHKFTLDGNNFSESLAVAAVNSESNDALVDGAAYTVTLSYQDEIGQDVGADENPNFTYDITPPAIPSKPAFVSSSDTGMSDYDGITQDNTPVFQGTSEANALVSIYIDDRFVSTTTANETGDWTFTIASADALEDGTYQLQVTATDAAGNESALSENLTAVFDNQGPVILSQGTSIQLDADGNATLTVADIAEDVTDNVSPTEILGFTMDKTAFTCAEAGGVNTVNITVTDQAGNTAIAAIEVTVEDTTAPEISAEQLFAIDENAAVETEVGVLKISDNCSVKSYSIIEGNTGEAFVIDAEGSMRVNQSSALDYETHQTFALRVEVADEAGNTSSAIVNVQLKDVNEAPVLAGIATMVIGDELSLISFGPNATDVDTPAGELEYSLEDGPQGALIEASTGVFSWTPTEEQGPQTYTFSLVVTDGALSDAKEVTIEVNEVNHAPEITSEAILSAKEGEAYSYQLIAVDADLPANTLTYEALEIPSWLSFDAASQILHGTPENDAEENNFISLQVSDGAALVKQEFTLTVEMEEEHITGLFDREAQQKYQVLVYPNPTQGTIVVALDNELEGERVVVSLCDLQGKQLIVQQGGFEQGMLQVNAYLQTANAGVYLLQLHRKEQVVRVKIVKE